jgi:uncharacterized protein with GYD domain
MNTYVFLVKNNPFAAAQLLNPAPETAEGQAVAMQLYGGKLIGHYVLTGQYDQLVIAALPDDAAAKVVMLAAAASGQTVDDFRAFDPGEMHQVHRLAARLLEDAKDTAVAAQEGEAEPR